MANIEACLSSGKDDWETPDDFFRKYDATYHFVLDAAANESNTKCPNWFGPGGCEEDALVADWDRWLAKGNIWLNPPYSRGLQAKFIKKAIESVLYGVRWDNHVVCLLPARTDTKLFHEVILPLAESVEFIKGRIQFVGAEHGAPFPSMVCVL